MGWIVLDGQVTLDGIMFGISFFSPFIFIVGFFRVKVFVLPRIFYDVEIHELVKRDVF